MELNQTTLVAMRPAIMQVWNYIGSDVAAMCGDDNEGAIEMCFDADRLLTCANNNAAHAMLKELMSSNDYVAVLQFFSKNIRLV